MRRTVIALMCLVPLVTTDCKKKDEEPLTTTEASQALEEASISGEASTLTSGSIEIATSFTVGEAVENAAQEIRDFVTTQMPCAKITLANATLEIEYGVNPGNCTWKGLVYTGKHSVTVMKNDMGDIEVDHAWTDLSNGRVKVSGTANVTWSLKDQSRHVVHELDWTRISDGRTATGSGDRTQTLLAGDLAEGIQEDGSHSWVGASGKWDLAIKGVQVRWIDPVPQAGTFTLTTPAGKTLTMTFERTDTVTIKVTIANGDKPFSFDVKAVTAEMGTDA